MDYKRFGRLNSKKIEDLKKQANEDSTLYDMEIFFPYLTTRSKSMDQRHTISSFKTMIKKYRYAYSLYDNCEAKIKINGLKDETERIEIDNKVYVFTDIPPYDFDGDNNTFMLLYDRKALIPAFNKKSTVDNATHSVLQDMKDRKISLRQYKLLKKFLSKIDFVSLNRTHITQYNLDQKGFDEYRDLNDSVFNEFVWRLVLHGHGIYKDYKNKEAYIKRKRSRVEDTHSLFHGYDRYGSLKYIHSFAKKLDDAIRNNQTLTANKLFYDFLEKNDNTFVADEFRVTQLLSDAKLIYEDQMTYLRSVKENYTFLLNPYSREYRHFFGKRKKMYSLFNSQQIMRKLKNEYHSIDDVLAKLEKEYMQLGQILFEANENYKKDLGNNQLPNQGFGFVGDGWSDDDGTGALMDEMREEADVQLELEKMERERMEEERKLEYLSDEEYLETQFYELDPIEFFENYEEVYFEYYGSIPIKEVLQIKQFVVTDDVSVEGEFSSFEEMSSWLEENCATYRL